MTGLSLIGRKVARGLLAGTVLAASAGSASGLTIIGNINDAGVPTTVAGGGTLGDVFGAAKSFWEAAISDSFTLTVNVSWGGLGGGKLGEHSLVSQKSLLFPPYRETAGNIVVDNGSTNWFIDATPRSAMEWSSFGQQTANLGGGPMNVGRVFTGATGDAVGRFDLFSVLLHEIGHALGMSATNLAYQQQTNPDNTIDLLGFLPYAGASLATANTGTFPNADFNPDAHLTTANGADILMQKSIETGIRRYASAADILAMCQLSTFTGCETDPIFGEFQLSTNNGIPEPASGLVIVGGLGLLGLLRRRTRRG